MALDERMKRVERGDLDGITRNGVGRGRVGHDSDGDRAGPAARGVARQARPSYRNPVMAVRRRDAGHVRLLNVKTGIGRAKKGAHPPKGDGRLNN